MDWCHIYNTGSGRNTWQFCKTFVSGTVGVGNLSLSALLTRLKAFQLPWSFCCGDVFQKQRFCLDPEDISSALQYSSELVSLVAILLPLRISQEQGVRKETKDNGDMKQNTREEVAAISPNMPQRVMQNFQKRLGECVEKNATSQTQYSGSEYCN